MDKINHKKIEVHESLTSMNSLSYSIISYGIFYGIKQAAFFFKLFENLISNEYLRVIPSLFFGYFISRAMLNITANVAKKSEWVSISIAAFDFLILCVIVDLLNQKNWIDITNLLTFCAFVTYLGFWLNNVFVEKTKQKRKEAQEKQNVADNKVLLASLKQETAAEKQKLTELNQNLADIKQKTATEEQKIKAINQELEDRTCPHCGDVRKNKKSRDAHAALCGQNPKNIKNKLPLS
ncbi:hypothetical protein [uncultured Tenacibaculum sp.]|uniref:hypothetical protein n=1 Tax=uncultured Tenacibaculum sp. TaxID=174713 RepID=UPI00260E3EBB|nr:hypothetical protein [uncultured Tenacibaculum sp.]